MPETVCSKDGNEWNVPETGIKVKRITHPEQYRRTVSRSETSRIGLQRTVPWLFRSPRVLAGTACWRQARFTQDVRYARKYCRIARR